ncbi:33286_t:CDS:2 [Gigaspora margarita]|uniref:33286_t:CDS:1 n=1 Tax=Gigaspora margarita TaxID=4874 RepID=A0ABN7UHR3_GIGMA|nr:33286_t:CDS:2 [Gigaspora margarita]
MDIEDLNEEGPMSNKKKQLEVNSIAQTSNSSQSNSYYINIEQDSSSDELSSDEVEEIISRQFQDAENLNEPVNIAFEIELDSGLIESTLPESWLNIHNPKDIKKSFYQLINIVLLPLEHGSGYYWEVRKIYLNTRKKEFTEDRKWQRPEDQPIKRRSEALIVQDTHQQMHERPQYRKFEFPEAAKLWNQDNIKYNLQNSELYRCLQHHNLINVQIHTKEQTYYWASQNFKITFYLENDFIRALGFTISLLDRIGITKIKEIIVDSTFKTNQERFELFVVNTNCGGFGVPIAYLYLLTCDATVEAYNNPQNQFNTRVQALLDKDAGQISAIEEAWSWTTNLQLCYWHLEHAIDRRLKNKKLKMSGHSKNKAIEAHQQFNFIDPSWIPSSNIGNLCSDNKIQEIINIVKRHSLMHPLIPVAKNTFWSSTQIYQYCTQEKRLLLFSRSSYPLAIPLARTTIIAESHWQVLKYRYKYNYNRPRLDRLTQIIVEQMIADFDIKLTHYFLKHSFPTWWNAFKLDWIKKADINIEHDMDKRYHIDTTNWICSCPAYLYSRYLLCKHLIAKKNGKNFLPTFLKTKRRHDYPIIYFVVNSSSSNLQNMELVEKINVNNEIEEKLAHYKKIFDSALILYRREKDNPHFVKNFGTLLKPVVKAIEECESKLNARTQQRTWRSKNNLAFWLR